MNQEVISQLQVILNTYQSIIAFFYKRIIQNQYTNNTLNTYKIDYTLLLPASEYITNLNEAQVNAQVQAYIDLCTTLVAYITNNANTQTNIFYEQIQNTLNTSISNLNGFSISLLDAQYNVLFNYTVPYGMSLSTALYLNNLSLNTYFLQLQLNNSLSDANNIIQGTILTFSR